jgi:GT2 family glycosyltransferase
VTTAAVAIPTHGRAAYLEVALASIAPQAAATATQLLVVLDGDDEQSAEIALRHGAQTLILPTRSGLNAARNAAVAHTSAETVIFVDDDVEAPAGWLAAMLAGVAQNPEHAAFGGPITAWLEGGGPRHCGREPAPITTLDLGPQDRDCRHVWGANLALRRTALARVGGFDERLNGRGDEEEWLDRLAASGGRVRYLAAAGLIHRRSGADATLGHLASAAYHLGRASRANDVRKAEPPTLGHELRQLAGAGWHTVARRCSYGIVFAAHAVGRITQTLVPRPPTLLVTPVTPVTPAGALAPPADFVSGHSGYVAGRRATGTARMADVTADARGVLRRRRLARDATLWGPTRRVQVLALEREDAPNILDAAIAELLTSHHDVRVARTGVADRGRFENLNRLLASPSVELAETDWLVILDDDVALGAGFLDAFLFLAERYRLTLAQPAHRRFSHAAWPVTRRRSDSVVRETGFVEIGPVVAFHRNSFTTLLPFPALRVGWGVDSYWAALAAEHDWRIGVVDATPITHALRPVAASYDQSAALAESRGFLAAHPHISPAQANRTLHTHRSW